MQQSALVRHAPVFAQQRPVWQSSEPQQPSDEAHAVPVGPQQRLVPATSAHERPPVQHAGAAAEGVHVVDSARLHASAWQVPDWHVSPAQQSAFAAQVCDDVRHAHAPAVHSIDPQHCTLDVQAARASAQQSCEVGDARHDSPVQHDDAAVQALPAAVHIGGLTHTRALLQVSPAPHADPVAQHA